MQIRKMVCMILVCVLMIGTLSVSASAVETTKNAPEIFTANQAVVPFATNSFSMTISAKTKALADTSFSMMSGETVTIKASYAPFDASVDFGLVDSDGVFHYFNITNGSIDKTMRISKSGKYTLQVKNNSDVEVKVSGFVNY